MSLRLILPSHSSRERLSLIRSVTVYQFRKGCYPLRMSQQISYCYTSTGINLSSRTCIGRKVAAPTEASASEGLLCSIVGLLATALVAIKKPSIAHSNFDACNLQVSGSINTDKFKTINSKLESHPNFLMFNDGTMFLILGLCSWPSPTRRTEPDSSTAAQTKAIWPSSQTWPTLQSQ